MTQPDEIADIIWNSPNTEIIDIEKKTADILRAEGITEDFVLADKLERFLPLIRGFIEQKIEKDETEYREPKFLFSQLSENTLIGSAHLEKSLIFGRMSDEIVEMIHDCNSISESKGKGIIFNITSTTQMSHSLIRRPAKNKENFGKFIDALYKIFYEGASEDRHLRIPEKFFTTEINGEPVSIDDFIIFDIKHLRTNFEHDTDSVDHPEKTKTLIVQVCTKYTGKTTIIGLSPNEFLEFQNHLFINIITFLKTLKADLLSC